MSTAYLPTTNSDCEHILLRGATLIDGNGGNPLTDSEIEVEDGRIVLRRCPAHPRGRLGGGEASDHRPAGQDDHARFHRLPRALRTLNREPDGEPRPLRLGTHRAQRSQCSEHAHGRGHHGPRPRRNGPWRARQHHTGPDPGPRIHLAITPLSPTGGHTDFTMPNGMSTMPEMPINPIIDTDDDVRRTIRTLVRSGADVIKVCTTGGVSSPSDTPDDIGVPEEHVRLIVEETAKRAGQPVAAHAQGAEGIKAAIRGGVRSVEHGYGIDDEGIDLMLEHGTFLVPTLSSALRGLDPKNVPGYLYEKKVKWSAIARERVAVAMSAGVKVALGTDAGVCPHGLNLREEMHAVELGLTPMQAIVAGTKNAAELLRLSADVGTLEEGKLADLVVVDFDPLADITKLAEPDNVKAVVQGGSLVKDSAGWFNAAIAASALG